MSPYANKPPRLLTELIKSTKNNPQLLSYCAGFEVKLWRCNQFAENLMNWIPDYALKEDELDVHHGNMFVRFQEAAVRIYNSKKYQSRGELGEIALHAICRDFFDPIPLAPRVFYLTSSNDVVKSFDMVHVRYKNTGDFELWLGEAKLYKSATSAAQSAIKSIKTHIDQGFLTNEKLILGPQISKTIPKYQEIRDLFSKQTSLDNLFKVAVFPICIACDSKASLSGTEFCDSYLEQVSDELQRIAELFSNSGLAMKIKIMLIYIPLASKDKLTAAFDKRLKAFAP